MMIFNVLPNKKLNDTPPRWHFCRISAHPIDGLTIAGHL